MSLSPCSVPRDIYKRTKYLLYNIFLFLIIDSIYVLPVSMFCQYLCFTYVRDLCSLKEAGPVRTRPARDASLYNARPLLRDLHHAHTADVHRRIRSVRLCVLLHV